MTYFDFSIESGVFFQSFDVYGVPFRPRTKNTSLSNNDHLLFLEYRNMKLTQFKDDNSWAS